MAFVFNLNQTPATSVGCMMQLWQTMVNAGWLVLSWSDGAAVGGATHGSPGAGFLGFTTQSNGTPLSTVGLTGSANNNQAWILMQQPAPVSGVVFPYAGTRQLVFEHGTIAPVWRIKYSYSGSFYSNPAVTGSQLVAPSGNIAIGDDVMITGGGTDAVPSYATVFAGTEGAMRCNTMADDGTMSASVAPYGFLLVTVNAGGGKAGNTAVMMDPMQVGSAPSGSVDPFVFYVESAATTLAAAGAIANTAATLTNATLGVRSWFKKGQSSQAWESLGASFYSVSIPAGSVAQTAPNLLGTNALNTFDDVLPLLYARVSSAGGVTGYKGVSSFIKWNAVTRFEGDSLSLTNPGTSRDRFCMGDANIPWDGATIPVI